MKGEIKKIDKNGRIVIPSNMQKEIGIEKDDNVVAYVKNGKIIIKKYIPKNNNTYEECLKSLIKEYRQNTFEGNAILDIYRIAELVDYYQRATSLNEKGLIYKISFELNIPKDIVQWVVSGNIKKDGNINE